MLSSTYVCPQAGQIFNWFNVLVLDGTFMLDRTLTKNVKQLPHNFIQLKEDIRFCTGSNTFLGWWSLFLFYFLYWVYSINVWFATFCIELEEKDDNRNEKCT